MKCYIISYDIKNNSQSFDYSELEKAIKSYGSWAHIEKSVWGIVTNKSASEIRDYLKTKIDSDDSIFIIKSGTESAWSNVICSNEWLKKNL